MTKAPSGEYEVATAIEVRRFEDALLLWHDILVVRYGDGRHLEMYDMLVRRRRALCSSLSAALALQKVVE